MEKSLTLRYNLSVLVLIAGCIAFPLMGLSDIQWLPVALMFAAGLAFGYWDGHAVQKHRDALLEAKDGEDVAQILRTPWRSARSVGALCVLLLGVIAVAFVYRDGALKIAAASTWSFVAGISTGRLPSLGTLKKYARSGDERRLPPNKSFERTREG